MSFNIFGGRPMTEITDNQRTPTKAAAIPGRYWALAVITLVYALNIADRFVLSTLIEPIKAEFHLSDTAVGFLTGVALALFYGRGLAAWCPCRSRPPAQHDLLGAGDLVDVHHFLRAGAEFPPASSGADRRRSGRSRRNAAIALVRPTISPGRTRRRNVGLRAGHRARLGPGGIEGGLLADHYGWRYGLILFACLSLPILGLLLTVREPRRGVTDSPDRRAKVGIGETLRFIASQRALVHIIAGATIATFSGMGLVWWTPAFLSQSHGFTVGDAGVTVGLMSGAGEAAALIATTLVTLRLAKLRQSGNAICSPGSPCSSPFPASLPIWSTATGPRPSSCYGCSCRSPTSMSGPASHFYRTSRDRRCAA